MTRTEPCVCGGLIRGGEWQNSRPLVEAHNRSLRHMSWRWAQGIVTPDIGGPDDPRRRWPTADDSSVDAAQGGAVIREGDVGASADGVEGSAA